MKTYEIKAAVSPRSLEVYHGAIIVDSVTFASGADIIADAREIGLGGFHLVCKSSHLFQLLTEMLNAGARVIGTGLVDKRVYQDEWETISTLKIAVDPLSADAEEVQWWSGIRSGSRRC